MKSFLKRIFGKDGKGYTEKTTTQSLPTKLKLEALTDKEPGYIQNNIGLALELMKNLKIENDIPEATPQKK